jgi:zinc/manganese transport system substrate-binding protein
MRLLFLLMLLPGLVPGLLAAERPVVAALHPLMADLALQVGGGRVEVFDLLGDGDPHRFEPRPQDIRRLQGSRLVLAAGKGMEPYLGRLRDTLGAGVVIVEVGRTIPSLTVGKDAVYTCCPQHAAGGLDPHWWHGIENMRRAARVVADALAALDPAGRDTYLANAAAYGTRLAGLKTWARSQLARVPRAQRKLVTAHNAFAYFAREFGFEVIAVAGLTREQNNAPQELARSIGTVRRLKIKALFPERNANPKALEAIGRETGAALAAPLIADGAGQGAEAGFEGMIRHNVAAIVAALGD